MVPGEYQQQKIECDNMVYINFPQPTVCQGKEEVIERSSKDRYRLHYIFGDYSCRRAGIVTPKNIAGKKQ